jgi:hypothetical protein
LGFIEKGADPVFIVLIHPDLELYIDVVLDAEGNIHGYELLPFEALDERQEKFRW